MPTITTNRSRLSVALRIVTWILGIIGGGLLLAILFVGILWATVPWGSQRSGLGVRARSVYESARAATMIDVPKQAVFHSASEQTALMNYLFEAEFSLPEDRSPEKWLQDMASASGLSNSKTSKHVYDGGGDECMIEYIPMRDRFRISIRID